MDEENNSIKVLPCDVANKLIESGCEEKLAYAVSTLYDTLVTEYGEEYQQIILDAILSCKYEIAREYRMDSNGKKTNTKEDVKAVLKRNNFPLDFISKEDLNKRYVYASYPEIKDKTITNVNRMIVMPDYFNDESPASIGMLVNSINSLVKSYINEYKIDGNFIIRRRGLATYRYDINSHKLIDSFGFGLEKGLNDYDERAIVIEYYDQDGTYDLEKTNDNVLVAGMLMDGGVYEKRN